MEPLTKSYVSNYDPEKPVRDITIYQVFKQAKDRGFVGEIVNLETGTNVLTTDIFRKADQYAKGFLAIGLAPGKDAIAFLGGNSLETVSIYVAATSIGIAFAKPYVYTPKDKCIVNVLEVLEAKAVVVGEAEHGDTFSAFVSLFEDQETPTCRELPLVKHVFYDNSYKDRSPQQRFLRTLDKLIELGKNTSDEQLEAAKKSVSPDHILSYVFSSGSTGKPKCIAHASKGYANDLCLIPDDHVKSALTVNPSMDEVTSFGMVTVALAGKISKLFLSMEISPANIEQATNECTDVLLNEGIEMLGMGGHLAQLIAHYVKSRGTQAPHLRYLGYGGQVVARQFKENMRSIMGKIHFTGYGSSEMGIVSHTLFAETPEAEESRMEAKLYIMPNTEIRLVNKDDEIVDIGEDGELQLKSHSLFKMYKGMPEKTRAAFTDDGFYKTGDMAVMYPDGSHQINGRAVDAMRFKIMGKVVYPGPIEEIILKYPGVQNASVSVAGNNDAYGDEVTYCLNLYKGVNEPVEADLMAFLKEENIDKHQMPARILYFDRLPPTPNHRKISRPALKEEIQRRVKADPNAGITNWYRDVCTALAEGFTE